MLALTGARRLGSYPWPEDGWPDLPGVRRDEAVLAVTRLGGWALLVEDSAPIGADDDVIARLSGNDRTVVTCAHNFEADDRFVLARDGVVQVDFDPRYPVVRAGADPDRLLADMRSAGLDLSDNPDPGIPSEQAALALAEHVTGVRLTAGLLHDSTYLAGAVPGPDGEAVNRLQPPAQTRR